MPEDQLTRDVALVKQWLEPLPSPMAHPALVLLAGLPGTGKSHFARQLAERVSAVVVASDVVRRLLFERPRYSFGESAVVFRVCHRLIDDLLRSGVHVIFDATNLLERHREPVYRIAERAGARLVVVHVEAPPVLAHQRLESRLAKPTAEQGNEDSGRFSDATRDVYERMRPQWEPISRNHFVVDTSGDLAAPVQKLAREVLRAE